MRLRLAMAVIAMCVVGFASIASAQPGGRGPGGPGGFSGGFGGGGMIALLRIEAVQKELDLTAEQIAEIDKLLASARGGDRGGDARRPGARPEGQRRPGGEDGERRRPAGDNTTVPAPAATSFVVFQQDDAPTDEERRARFEEFRKQAEERQKEMQAKLAEILLPHQLDRLKQIYIQVQGVGALQDAEIAKELGISDEQKEKMAEVRTAAGAKMRELFQGGDREAAREKFAELRESINKDVLALLTTEQQEKFEKMKGEKFEMPEGALRGGGDRRPGGDGARPGGERRRPEAANPDA